MFLTDTEIAEICAPLKMSAAQIRYLRSLGLTVNKKPNGRPLVVRSHAERVLSGLPAQKPEEPPAPRPGSEPNREALLAVLAQRKIRPNRRATE